MIPLHPAVVHFPIALLVASVVLDAVGVVFRRAGLTQAGFALLVAGGIGAALAALSGPEEDVKDAATRVILTRHELTAAATITLALVLIGVRIGNMNGLRGSGAYGYLALGVLVIVALTATGYFGGQMTYEHGVGVAQLQGATAPDSGGGNIGEMWAKLGGVALLIVVAGNFIYFQKTLRERFARWQNASRASTPTEQPTLWTLGK